MLSLRIYSYCFLKISAFYATGGKYNLTVKHEVCKAKVSVLYVYRRKNQPTPFLRLQNTAMSKYDHGPNKHVKGAYAKVGDPSVGGASTENNLCGAELELEECRWTI
jgi:hypothetical protein